jgi:hypothetical protein
MISSLSKFAQDMTAFASSIVAENQSRQPKGRQRPGSHVGYVTMHNCVDINGSNIDGLTMNNGGSYNSGAGASFLALFPGSF